jgi:hypothetical protein
MIAKNKITAFAVLTLLVLAMTPLTVLAQGQFQSNSANQIVSIAERASTQVQALIDSVDANPDAATAIEEAGLTDQYNNNVTLFITEGADSLEAAKEALEATEYDAAVDNAFEALGIFREVYRSIQSILAEAGLKPSVVAEGQGMLEAIDRELARIERLRDVLPENAPTEITNSLDHAEDLLVEAKDALLAGNLVEARAAFLGAKQSIVGVYQYLKEEAEVSNEWRLNNYCQGLQERIQERFRYGRQSGANVDSILQSLGYQSESQFMDTIQNQIQTSLNEQNFEGALQGCEQAGTMVQQMEQAISQQMNQQGPSGSTSSGPGFGGNGGKP